MLIKKPFSIKGYYIGPYEAIILPCLFPWGAPLGCSDLVCALLWLAAVLNSTVPQELPRCLP